MSAGFTPGPWFIDHKANPYSPPSKVVATQDCVIAEVFGDDDKPEAEAEVLACANLIAAAPELYEALEKLVKRTPFKAAEGGITVFLSLEQIAEHRAALAKARGDA